MRLFEPRDRHPRPSRRAVRDASTCSRTRRSARASRNIRDWPTIPQLYVKGEFVGGSDIMMEMFESGELQQLVGAGRLSSDRCKRKRDGGAGPENRFTVPFVWRGTKWTALI